MDQPVTIDDKQVRKMFADLSPKDRKKVFKQAIRSSLNIVKKQTISNLKNVVTPSAVSRKDAYGNSFRKGIKVKAYRKGDSGVIHILGNYKLKFFEMGTQKRYTFTFRNRALRKPRYVGQIPAYHFFKSARQQTEEQVFNNLDYLVSKSIQKINDKYK